MTQLLQTQQLQGKDALTLLLQHAQLTGTPAVTNQIHQTTLTPYIDSTLPKKSFQKYM